MTKQTGLNGPEGYGMGTKIVVVDGADGLTPDMLRAPQSPYWESEIGTVTCRSCRSTWVCHFMAWLGGGFDCARCGGHDCLEWDPQ